MRKILMVAGRYLPGYRDGGPVRSLINLTDWLGDEYDIRIICHDRDHGDDHPYPGITYGKFDTVGKAKVWYTEVFSADIIERLAKDADVVYVAGLYDLYARLTMKLKKAGRIAAPVYVAPMGSFSPEAFKIKGIKKRAFVLYMKMTGMFDNVVFSVTSKREADELEEVIGSGYRHVIAADLPRRTSCGHVRIKEKGKLALVHLSRICRKKNLAAIPDIIDHLDADISISLDVYGTAEDEDYLCECRERLDALKKRRGTFRWEYKGEADSTSVPEIFAAYDAFLFPTLGENYGHVIAEALAAGCIPVISDTTPWLDLEEKGCGYVCALYDKAAFADALVSLARMSEEEMKQMRGNCYAYITSVNEASVTDSGYRKIFG